METCDICGRVLITDKEKHDQLCADCVEELWLTDDELVTEDDIEE